MKNKLLYISVLAILFTIAFYFLWVWREALLVMVKDDTVGQTEGTGKSDASCNIAVIPIIGDIIPYVGADIDGSGDELPPSTSADDVRSQLRAAENNPNMRGVLVRIDSGGGLPVSSEIITNALKHTSLPVVALIREIGTSGAYLIATGARTIIASPFSDVGSIGVTMSYVENATKNTQEGLQYVPLVSAQFKDYGNPDKPLTQAERLLLERDLRIYHKQFVKEVAENRNLPLEQIAKLADGSSMPGALALENGLVDTLGDQETARVWFADNLTISHTNVVFCE